MATAGAIPRVHKQRIGIVNVDLGLQERHAQVGKRLRAGGKLDHQQLVLGKGMLVEDQDLPALLGMAHNQPQDRAIGRVGDRQPDDLHSRTLERTIDIEQLAHPVFQENRILGDGRPASTWSVSSSTSLPPSSSPKLMRVLAVLGQAWRTLTFSLRKFNFSNTLRSMAEVHCVVNRSTGPARGTGYR